MRLKYEQWIKIEKDIVARYPKSVWMMHSKMKEVLGFNVRTYNVMFPEYFSVYILNEKLANPCMTIGQMIVIDFFDEPKRTMFLLKYADILSS